MKPTIIPTYDYATAEAVAMREGYGQALVELGRSNLDVVVLEADVGGSSRSCLFGEAFPDRYFNVGIAENNMMAMAAGMAAAGKIPFVNTFAAFATLRAGDPLRTLVAYTKLGVKVAATYAGLSDSFDGATHQSVEDLAIARALPNMTIVVPTDAAQARQAVFVAASHPGPVFLRLSRAVQPVICQPDHPLQIGKMNLLRDGSDVALIACGYMVVKALEAADQLKASGISAMVWEAHTLKPLDHKAILTAAKQTGKIVTIEEHSIYGGLGSAVAEALSQSYPTPMRILGIPDKFGESGPYEQVLAHFGLDAAGIANSVREFVSGRQ